MEIYCEKCGRNTWIIKQEFPVRTAAALSSLSRGWYAKSVVRAILYLISLFNIKYIYIKRCRENEI